MSTLMFEFFSRLVGSKWIFGLVFAWVSLAMTAQAWARNGLHTDPGKAGYAWIASEPAAIPTSPCRAQRAPQRGALTSSKPTRERGAREHGFGGGRAAGGGSETRRWHFDPTAEDARVGATPLMGARFYAPDLGVWTIGDPVAINSPNATVGDEFAAANPYAYSNLNPVIATDPDGNFWHIVGGAVAGALIGGGIEAARQYIVDGKVHDVGRIAAAAGGGAVSGAITAACPGVAIGTVVAVGAVSGAAGGVTERLVASGGKDAGTLGDAIVDAGVGAVTAGVLKGASKVIKKSPPVKPPSQKPPTTVKGDWDDIADPLDGVMDRFEAEVAVRKGGFKLPAGGSGTKALPAPRARGNPNPIGERGTFYVDPKGNVIPTPPGGRITGSPDGRFIQARDAAGKPTGVRIDGPHRPATHPDPRAQQPHGHVPGVTNPDGTPWLPVKQ